LDLSSFVAAITCSRSCGSFIISRFVRRVKEVSRGGSRHRVTTKVRRMGKACNRQYMLRLNAYSEFLQDRLLIDKVS
jgi:hypothetical protein